MTTKLGFVHEMNGQLMTIEIFGNKIHRIATFKDGIPYYTTNIGGLKLNISGIVKEFPDLKGKPIPEIKKQGVKRFYDHISTFSGEQELIKYLKQDLQKHNWKMRMVEKHGHRPRKL